MQVESFISIFSASFGQIWKISVPIIKRISQIFRNTPYFLSLCHFEGSYSQSKINFRATSFALGDCMSVCLSVCPPSWNSFTVCNLDSSRMFQTVPECSRMFWTVPECMQFHGRLQEDSRKTPGRLQKDFRKTSWGLQKDLRKTSERLQEDFRKTLGRL